MQQSAALTDQKYNFPYTIKNTIGRKREEDTAERQQESDFTTQNMAQQDAE